VSEEEAERARGTFYGYKKTSGANVASLRGSDSRAIYDRVVNRLDIVTGKKERRLDVGFEHDGLVSADVASWMSRVMAEFFSHVCIHYGELLALCLSSPIFTFYIFNFHFYSILILCFLVCFAPFAQAPFKFAFVSSHHGPWV